MKRGLQFSLVFVLYLSACLPVTNPAIAPGGAANSTPEDIPQLALSMTALSNLTATVSPTPAYPPEGYGPKNFPQDVDPLTGMKVTNTALLERRPIIIKVSNLPRDVRPQWGLSLADIVYEYYIEEGTSRFAAIYYSKDANQVGDIRSGRFFDAHLVRMYKAIFAFGSADYRVRDRLYAAEFANRLILEWQAGCPAMCRFSPPRNYLLGNTSALSAYATQKGIPNGRQNLDGMFFQLQAPAGGVPVQQVFVRYSAVIYNRWDYDPASGRFLRFSDKDNDLTGTNEIYEQLRDRLTSQPIATDNLVILFLPHQFYSSVPEIVDIAFEGSGWAYAFRDGQAYQVKWQRPAADSVLYLTNADGTFYPFKPGTTWFEVIGISTRVTQNVSDWRFLLYFP